MLLKGDLPICRLIGRANKKLIYDSEVEFTYL